MKNNVNILYFLLIVIIAISPKVLKANSYSDAKTRNYVGSINKKLNVVFSFTQVGNNLKGYYYYDKIGVNIELKGELVGGVIILNEISEQGKTVAKITLKQKSAGLYGTWQSLVDKKSYAVDLTETTKEIPQLPAHVLGDYNFKNDRGCKITLSITKSNKGYHFYYQTAKRQLKGKVTFARSLEEKLVYVNLHGIEWAEDSGDVSKDDDDDNDRVLPTVVQGLLTDTAIVIQNTGNAMNYYVKLSDCDEKFIELIKWKRPN